MSLKDKNEFYKSIPLGKKDKLIIKWGDVVKNDDRGKQAFLVKQALLNYIKTGTFINIGAITYNEKDVTYTKRKSITLWLADCPEILEWMNNVEKNGIRCTNVIREVLKRCIHIVECESDVKVPSYIDFSIFDLESSNLDKSNISKLKISEEKESSIIPAENYKEENNKKKMQTEPIKILKEEKITKAQSNKKIRSSRASNLTGKIYKN